MTKLLVASATSTERRKAYAFSLGFFCSVDDRLGSHETLFVMPSDIVAPDFIESGTLDVLIGMDILSAGTATFDRHHFSFSF